MGLLTGLVLDAQGKLNDAKPLPMELENPSTRSGEQVGRPFGAETRNA